MNNLGRRYDGECCAAAERLVEYICAMEKTRVELAYRRLVELLQNAERRREERNGISQTA